MSPSEFLMEELSREDIDDVAAVVVLRRYKSGAIAYGSNDQSRTEIYSMANITQAFLLSDIIAQDVKREL
jgi:hypothetical protein